MNLDIIIIAPYTKWGEHLFTCYFQPATLAECVHPKHAFDVVILLRQRKTLILKCIYQVTGSGVERQWHTFKKTISVK